MSSCAALQDEQRLNATRKERHSAMMHRESEPLLTAIAAVSISAEIVEGIIARSDERELVEERRAGSWRAGRSRWARIAIA